MGQGVNLKGVIHRPSSRPHSAEEDDKEEGDEEAAEGKASGDGVFLSCGGCLSVAAILEDDAEEGELSAVEEEE